MQTCKSMQKFCYISVTVSHNTADLSENEMFITTAGKCIRIIGQDPDTAINLSGNLSEGLSYAKRMR